MNHIFIISFLFTIFIYPCLLIADVVYLKDGGKIEGIIINDSGDVVVIEIGVGTTSVDKIDILRIDSSSTSDESKLRSEWKINKRKTDVYSKELKSKKPVTNKAIVPYEPKEIIIFTTDWCPRCYEAKAFFDQNGIKYTEYDIEKSEIGKQMYKAYGVEGVPLVVIDKAQFLGFRPQAMIAELRKYEKYR